MSTLRISNIEAKADNSSPTVDEQLKFTNSTGDLMLYLDGRTSGITTVGINTTNQTIKFDANNNVMITGIVTATEFHGTLAVGTSVTYGDNEKAYFGNGLDLEIYHSGSDNFITADTQNLILKTTAANKGTYIQSDDHVHITTPLAAETMAKFIKDGAVELNFNDTKRIETTNTGAVVTGILTATTFSGSIAASNINSGTVATARLGSGTANNSVFLRGDSTWAAVTQTTINNNANNRIITGSGTANTLEGEATLTYDGTSIFELQPSSATPARFIGDADRTGQGQHLSQFEGNWNGTLVGRMVVVAGEDTSNKDDGHLDFFTTSSGGSNERRVRISSDGNLLVGTTTSDQRFRVYKSGTNGYKTALFDSNSTHGTRVVITNSNNTSNRGLGIIVGGQYAGTDRASFGWFNSDNTYVSPNLMTIQADGKIGIGRNDPVNFVDIARGSDEENILIVRGADNTTEYGAMGIHSGNCVITGGGAGSTNTGIMFRTAASGSETNRLLITSAGNVEPATDNTYNFGSLTKRWANLYTADINLSNEGSKNDVDGTWGQYTIQEGQDDLFLINKRNGKKYKFLLQEVS